MTDIAWLAALLSPRSVAPHQNFGSVDQVTPAGLLALVIQGRQHEVDRAKSRLASDLTSDERALIDAATGLSQSGTITSSVNTLIKLATNSKRRAGMRTAACLLASMGLGELDMHDQALKLLRELTQSARRKDDDWLLLQGALRQQAAMRAFDSNQPFEEDRDIAAKYLGKIVPSKLSRYPTSRGSRWRAQGTNREIVSALLEANQDLFDLETFFPAPRTLQTWLRRPGSELIRTSLAGTTTGLTAYLDEAFNHRLMSGERSFRTEDPVDAPLWRALTFLELLGHARQARAHRVRLSKCRLLRSSNPSPDTLRECLRLLRHGAQLKPLRLALTFARSYGPLHGLQDEAQQILERRLTPALLRDVELAVLQSSAQLLTESDASNALDVVLIALKSPELYARRGELPSIHAEHLLRAAGSLASVANREELLASVLLDRIEDLGAVDDELLANAYARGLSGVDWSVLSTEATRRWRRWCNSERTVGWSSVLDLVSPRVRLDANNRTEIRGVPSFSEIANELNAIMAGSEVPVWLVPNGAPLIRDALENARQQAARGTISFGSTDVSDLAACMNLHAGADLWDPLAQFLVSSRIPQSQRAAALNRLADAPESVPRSFRLTLSAERQALLATSRSSSFFGEAEQQPFPAAVRFLASVDEMTDEELLEAMTSLAVGNVAHRLEAARTLASVTKHRSSVDQWVVAMALSLGTDSEATVRAETGRSLCNLLAKTQFAHKLLLARMLGLLAEDGILVPLLVLQGLSASESETPGSLLPEVRRLSREHPAKLVRVQASFVADNEDRGPRKNQD